MTDLFKHQQAATEAALEAFKHGLGFGVWFEMGGMKTLVALEVVRRSEARRVLVVCPKSVIEVWPAEARKHGYTDLRVVELRGSGRARAEQVERWTGPVMFVTNYESVWREPLSAALSATGVDLPTRHIAPRRCGGRRVRGWGRSRAACRGGWRSPARPCLTLRSMRGASTASSSRMHRSASRRTPVSGWRTRGRLCARSWAAPRSSGSPGAARGPTPIA